MEKKGGSQDEEAGKTAELTKGMWVARGCNLSRNAGFDISVALVMTVSGF